MGTEPGQSPQSQPDRLGARVNARIQFYVYTRRKCDMCGKLDRCMTFVSRTNKVEHNYCGACLADIYVIIKEGVKMAEEYADRLHI